MSKLNLVSCFLMSVSLMIWTSSAYAADQKESSGAKSSSNAMSDQEITKSAMAAAPAQVAKNATVVAMDANGKMRTVRKGTNGFTCMGDNPETPGPDPMCADKHAMEWLHAYLAHEKPPAGKVGFMYMLAGGTDASNTDPYAKGPTATNNWIKTGPHVMVVGAEPDFYDNYPKSADPDTSSPYVMWAGTPYQHLMAPVK